MARSIRRRNRRLRKLAGAAAAAVAGSLAIVAPATAAPLTAGNVVVCRVGTGSGSLVNSGNPVFLDEYTASGTLVQSIALPTAANGANKAFFVSGVATSECLLTNSVDGRYVTTAGYAAQNPGGSSLASTSGASINRVVARVDASGSVDTTTAMADFADGNNPRSAVTTDGTSFWLAGGAGSARSTALGASSSTQLNTTVTNLRQIDIAQGQVYASSGSGTTRLATVGSGLPTTSGQAITNLPGFPASSNSPYEFFFADLSAAVAGVDTVFIADDGTNSIQKYSLVSGTWVAKGSITASGVRGLAGIVNGATVTLFATTGGSGATGGGSLYKATDATGYNANASGSATTIATAATNTAFRGVALAPVAQPDPVVPEVPWVPVLSASAMLLVIAGVEVGRRRRTHVLA